MQPIHSLKLSTVALAVLILAGCALLPATRSEQAATEPTPTPIPTAAVALKPTYTVSRGEVVKLVTFSGRISPVLEEELFFRVNGRVRTVNFKRNAQLKKGDIIADLEIDALERELKAAQLELDRSKVILAEAQQALAFDQRIAQTQLEMAEIRLDGMKNDHESTRAAIAEQQKVVDLAQIQVDRLATGVSALLQNDVTRTEYAVQKLNEQIAEAQVAAPFDGLLLAVSLSPGREVIGYQTVATLADVSKLEITADLLSDKMVLLAEKMTATMTLSARPGDKLHGNIRVLPYPYGSGGSGKTIEEQDKSTRISLEESAEAAGYQLGDLVQVTVEVERKNDALWLPPQAIRNFNGRLFAVVQDGDVQRRVDVKIGIEGEDRVEIEEGLEEGQTVVGP